MKVGGEYMMKFGITIVISMVVQKYHFIICL